VRERRGKPVATDEPTVLAEASFDSIVVEDGQSDGGLAYPASEPERLR